MIEDVKKGLDINLEDNIIVLNGISLSEKEEQKEVEKKEEPKVEEQSKDLAPEITPDVKLGDLNPADSQIPNVEIPLPDFSQTQPTAVPFTNEPTINSFDQPVQMNQFSQPNLYEIPTAQVNINDQNNNDKLSFKSVDSVKISRDEFLKACGEFFDKKITVPVTNLVNITNGAMDLLNDTFQNGIRQKSFEEYNKFKEMYNNLTDVNDDYESDTPKYEDSSLNNNSINFPSF